MGLPVIALDIDDTVFGHSADLIDWYNQTYGTDLKHEEYFTTDLSRWGVAIDEDAIRRVHAFYDTPTFREAKPFNDALIALERLSKKYQLVFVTARDSLLEEFTHQWLKEHFRGLYTEVHFTARFSLEGKSRSKIDVCREIKAAYIIDDTLKTCTEAAAAGIHAVLFGDYPWNTAKTLPDDVVRCNSWNDVERYFA